MSFASDSDQLVLPASKANFLSMGKARFPFGIRMVQMEVFVIVVFIPVKLDMEVEAASFTDRHPIAKVHTGLIQCNRVKGGKHADIGNNGNIIFRMAVAERRHVADQ